MNWIEKATRRLKTQAAIAEVSSVRLRQAGDYDNADDWIRTSRELYNIINLLTAPIGQQGEPVAEVFGSLITGDSLNYVYDVIRNRSEHLAPGTSLYLHPPSSREREALQKLRELGTEGVYVALEYFRGVWSLEARSEETADVVYRTDGADDPADAILGGSDE